MKLCYVQYHVRLEVDKKWVFAYPSKYYLHMNTHLTI